jgi:hypothetical protein
MRTLEATIEALKSWHRSDSVGNLILYRYPGAQLIETIEERVVKVKEMDEDVAAAFILFMDKLGIERGEIFRNNRGEPDRVKLTRRIDV